MMAIVICEGTTPDTINLFTQNDRILLERVLGHIISSIISTN